MDYILQETVAIEVSMQSENYGEIMQISPDYFVHLGNIADELGTTHTPIGKNINMLMPEMFKQLHEKHMKETFN